MTAGGIPGINAHTNIPVHVYEMSTERGYGLITQVHFSVLFLLKNKSSTSRSDIGILFSQLHQS